MLYLRNTDNSLDLDRGKQHVVVLKHTSLFGLTVTQCTNTDHSLELDQIRSHAAQTQTTVQSNNYEQLTQH